MSCTHCGICLESCPTYTLWGAEADSPRGRIVLIEDVLAPGGAATAEMAAHIDSCLGCMACMSVCPEDVAYADLLATAQVAIERDLPRPAGERLRRRAALSGASSHRAAQADSIRAARSRISRRHTGRPAVAWDCCSAAASAPLTAAYKRRRWPC